MKPIEFIRNCPPFDSLTADELALAVSDAERIEFAAGAQILTRGGEPSQYMYLIESGSVSLLRDGVVQQDLATGEIFGYTVLVRNESPSFDVIVDETLTAYRISDLVCQKLIDNAEFASFFLQGLADRLQSAAKRISPPPQRNLATPVKQIMTERLLFIEPGATVQEAARMMHDARASSVLVRTEPPGIVTDRDLRGKVLAQGLGPETAVRSAMTAPLKTLDSDVPVYAALLHMLEENIHHLPLVEEGKIVGIVTSTDLIRHNARNPLYLLRRIDEMENDESAGRYAQESTAMVESLFHGGLDAAQIGQIVSALNDELVTRLLKLAEERLGPPPTPYSWIVFGSEGRLEQMLLTDQDNALVYAAEANGKVVEGADDYFSALSEQVVDGLIHAGFPPCPGGYMATNWHQPLAQWEERFLGWIRKPEPQSLMEASIFFDFRSVHGELSLESLESLIASANQQPLFINQMFSAARDFAPPLTFFRRIREDNQGAVDIKAGAIAPIVSLARTCALAAGSLERSTLERLAIAGDSGTMSRQGADNLAEIFRFLLRIRLRHQLEQMNRGEALSNMILVDKLSLLEKRHLKEALLIIREMQDGITFS